MSKELSKQQALEYPTGAGLRPVSSLLLIYEPKNHPK